MNRWIQHAARIVRLGVVLGGVIYTQACPDPLMQPPPRGRGVGEAVRRFTYQAARPIYEPNIATQLYVSGYAGKRFAVPARATRPGLFGRTARRYPAGDVLEFGGDAPSR